MQTRAVIFDLFGTLVDNLRIPEYDKVMHEVATVIGADPQEFLADWVKRYPQRAVGDPPTLHEGIRQISAAIGVFPDDQQISRSAELRVEFTRRNMQTRPESMDVLRQIRAMGLPTCLVSDCTWEVPMIWGETPYSGLFDGAVFSCSVGFKKPDPRMYQTACEKLGMEPQHCLYVGDGCSNELTGATDFGMRALQILAPHEKEEFYGRHSRQDWDGPLVTSISDVLDYIN